MDRKVWPVFVVVVVAVVGKWCWATKSNNETKTGLPLPVRLPAFSSRFFSSCSPSVTRPFTSAAVSATTNDSAIKNGFVSLFSLTFLS